MRKRYVLSSRFVVSQHTSGLPMFEYIDICTVQPELLELNMLSCEAHSQTFMQCQHNVNMHQCNLRDNFVRK